MAFSHGKNAKVYLNGHDVTSYLDSIEMPVTVDTPEVTTFGNTSKTYIAGLKDATMAAEGFYDGASGAIDDILSSAKDSTGASVLNWWYDNDTIGNLGQGSLIFNTNFAISATVDNAVRIAVAAQSKTASESVLSLKNLAASTLSTEAASQDTSSATSNGGAGYLQVTANESSALGVTIEHSASGSTWDTLVSFTTVTTYPASERVTYTGTTKQYVRAAWTTTQSSTFMVALNRR